LGEFQFYQVGNWQNRAFSIRRNSSSSQHAPVAFTPDGRTVALSASRYTIQLVRLPKSSSDLPKTIATLESPDHNSPLELLVFSPDGRSLAAATADLTIQLWNLARLRRGLAELDLTGGWPE
jgi:WD40 repeat protein